MSNRHICEIEKIGSSYKFPCDGIGYCFQKAKHSIVFKSGAIFRHSKIIVRLCNDHFYKLHEVNRFIGVLNPETYGYPPNIDKVLKCTFRENRL